MDIVQTPPINVSPVTDTTATWQMVDNQAPVDFTETLDGNSWSAEFLIENCGEIKLRTPVLLAADGSAEVIIPLAIGAALRSARRIDAIYQIRFSAPLPDMDTVWRGPVVVLEVTP